MTTLGYFGQWILGLILIASSLGVIFSVKPMHASLSFLLSLLTLAAIYVQLSAEFVGVMQILVYAGAILVIFVFVIVLFQDAHQQISRFAPRSQPLLIYGAITAFLFAFGLLSLPFITMNESKYAAHLSNDFGTVQSLGKLLYTDFSFPFEALTVLFLIAVVGSLYIAKREF